MNAFDLGDMPQRAPISTSTHPLEGNQNYQDRRERANQSLAAGTFGIGFALHLMHERAAVRIKLLIL